MVEPGRRSLWRWIVAAVVLLIILCALAFYRWFNVVEEASEVAARNAGPVEVTARELAVAFDEDPVAADIEYQNRPVTVTGPFRGMSLGPAGDPAISLGEDPVLQVTATFNKADATTLAGLRQGQPIRVTCATVTPGATAPALTDCELVAAADQGARSPAPPRDHS